MADKKRFVPDQMAAPDDVDPRSLRPFEPDEVLENYDGSHSTERLTGFNIDGKEVVAPSLWMSDKGPVDLERFPDTIIRAILEYEARTGKRFPRFSTPDQSTGFATRRSATGGLANGPLAR